MDTNWIYLKDVISIGNGADIHEALVTIKDSVIGSNKQKSALIYNGVLPDIIRICSDDGDITNKTEAFIILGSIAKGTSDNVEVLVNDYKILPLLKKELSVRNNYKYCLEIYLSTLCSILRHYSSSIEDFFDDTCTLTYFLRKTLKQFFNNNIDDRISILTNLRTLQLFGKTLKQFFNNNIDDRISILTNLRTLQLFGLTNPGNSLKTQIYVTTILFLLCQSKKDQLDLLNACAISNLARLINIENEHIQIPVLKCLCRMCFMNRSVSDNICVKSYQGRSMLDIINSLISRSFSPEIQLSAAKCLTYIYRSGTLLSSDFRIQHRTLPCLVRLCSENFNRSFRGSAAETLAYLIEIDAELQKTAAICNHLLKSLFQLIKMNNAEIKQAALKCFAALSANDETIRKKIMDTNKLIDCILESVNDLEIQVRLASVRCLHSLSRSVQQLRTTFQDHIIWEPLLSIMNNNTSTDFLIVVTSTLCNLLLEFSPAKTSLTNSGIIEKLSHLSEHEESSLKLNCIWALMNLAYQCENDIKTTIINIFGLKRILKTLNESNTFIILKTLGLLRNLLCHPYHINLIMSEYSQELFNSFCIILEKNYSSEIKEQVLCILGNIATECQQKDYITTNTSIMSMLSDLLFNSDNKLQAAALCVINNIVEHSDVSSENYSLDNCNKLNIFKNIEKLNKSLQNIQPESDYMSRTLQNIVIKCNKMYPEIFN